MIANLSELALGALLNLVVALIIVRGIYYPVTRKRGSVADFVGLYRGTRPRRQRPPRLH